jgi:4-hydroxy-2-oxoheptanedioate aldolase
MRGEVIRDRLHRGERVYGTHICSMMNPLHAKLATGLHLDFIFICNEHMPIDRTETGMMCQFWQAHGVAPIVRIPSPDPIVAAMALDAGAHGVCVPYIEKPDDVRRMVGAVHYRPIKGERLEEALSGSLELDAETTAFLRRFNRDNLLIIGVESVPAIARLEELISIPGVDGVFLGPHDISVSMGLPERYSDPRFIDAIEAVILRCRRQNIGVGLHYALTTMQPEHLRRLMDAGMNYIANDSDISVMVREMNRQLKVLREMNGDTFTRDGGRDPKVSVCLDPTV